MDAKLILKEENVKNAKSYLPLAEKEAFLDHCSMRCIQRVEVNLNDGGNFAMPNMFMEDTFVKSRYMMAAFVMFYLGIPKENVETEDGDEFLMTVAEYDIWAGSHVMNQLERMKGNAEMRDKVFDILRDYRDLEKRLSTAVYNAMQVMNDPANRLLQKIQMDTSEQALEAQKKNLDDLMSELEKMKKERGIPEEPKEGKE